VSQLSPGERRLFGRAGAYESWARTVDRSARTEPARRAFNAKFADEVDPNHELPEEERARLAEAARKAYYARLSAKSVQSRRRRVS
jgi:hypothetical protein